MQIYGLTETAPLLVANRARREDVATGDDERRRRLVRAGAPALGVQLRIAPAARCSPAATTSSSPTGASRRRPPRRSPAAGYTPATPAASTTAPHRHRPQEGHDDHRRRERRV